MLELFVARGHLAVSIWVHATLAACTWAATVYAADPRQRAEPIASRTAWERVRILAPLTTVSGLLVASQLAVFWHAAFDRAGATLMVPLLIAVGASLARARWVRDPTPPSLARALGVLALGAVSGAASLAGLAWLGHPHGAQMSDGAALSAGPIAAFVSPTAIVRIAHFGLAATALGATLLAVGAAFRHHQSRLLWSTRTALAAFVLQAAVGLIALRTTGHHEPAKLAAMAAQFETVPNAPVQLGAWPYDFGEKTLPGPVQFSGLLSTIVHGAAEEPVEGLLATHMEDRPPVAAMYVSTQAMAAAGGMAGLLLLIATVLTQTRSPPRFLLLLGVLPATLLSWSLLWLVTELGRYPWTIRGALRAGRAAWLSNAVFPAAALGVAASLFLAWTAFARCRAMSRDTGSAPASES